MKVKNDLDVIGDVILKDHNGNPFFKAMDTGGGGGFNNDSLAQLYFGDIDNISTGLYLELDVQDTKFYLHGGDVEITGGDLSVSNSLTLPHYVAANSSRIDNTVDHALGVDSSGNVKMIEKSTLGSASDSEAFFAYLSTGGGSVGISESTVGYNTISYNSNSDVFSMSAGVVTVDVAMTACISFTVSVAVPSATRVSVRAELQVSTDGGSNWNEVTGSRAWVYLRQGDNNDDHTIGSSVIIRDTAAGDKYRVTCRTMTGTASIVNYASNITIRDLKGGEAGPTGPAGADGATNTSLVLDGSNILTLTDSDSNTVSADLSSLAGGTTPTLDQVLTAGNTSTENLTAARIIASSALYGPAISIEDSNGAQVFTADGVVSSGTSNAMLNGSLQLSAYGSSSTISVQPVSGLGVDASGNVGLASLGAGKTIIDVVNVPTTETGSTSAQSATMYIVDLANTSGAPSYSLPGSGATTGDQIWIASNSTTSNHANDLVVSGKLFDTGSTIWRFGGRNSTTANYSIAGKGVLKWVWTGSYWYETTGTIAV